MDGDRPRAGIGTLPTPVTHMPDLGADLGVPDFYVKNEGKAGDLYGGNKVRKLDLLLGDALDRGCSRVVTGGSIGSNSVLATATYAREVSLDPAAIQFPQPVTDQVRENLRALAALDPDLRLTRWEPLLPAYLLSARLHSRFGDDSYYIPVGASAPLGTLGYVWAVDELAEQIAAGDLPKPDVMVVPTSTAGTHAGLQLGVDVYDLDVRVVGIQVAPRYVTNRFTVKRLANKTAALLDEPTPSYSRADIGLVTGYMGPEYAEPTAAGERVTEAARDAGLTLDPTYTAKTVAAIEGEFDDETVLYWHTYSETRPKTLHTAEAMKRLPDAYAKYLEE